MRLLLIADTHVPKRARDLPAEVWQQVEAAEAELGALKAQGEGIAQRQENIAAVLRDGRRRLSERNAQVQEFMTRRMAAQVEKERLDAEFDNLQNRIWEQYELTYGTALAMRSEQYDHKQAQERIRIIQREIRAMGTVNVAAVEEYVSVKERYDSYSSQKEDMLSAGADLEKISADLSRRMSRQYREQFEKLGEYFTQTFKELFGGGNAYISLQDEDNVLESGVEIHAQPPGKRLQHMSLLSGGERALTATAIVFAMLKLRPSPFCIMDEIEAALDEENVRNFGQFIREYAKSTQFVVVTHRKTTMEVMDRLYGVTMQESGVSSMVGIKMADYTEESA